MINQLAKYINFPVRGDERGSLIALESNQDVPFDIQRVYYIFATKENVSRGYHAHKALKQVAICVKGSCRFVLDDGVERQEFYLDTCTGGILIESMVWREMHDFSDDCVLLVLASEHYDESDYIRNYDEFLSLANKA